MKTEQILDALNKMDLSAYPLQKAQKLISSLGKIGGVAVSLSDCFITRARVGCGFKKVSDLSYNPNPSEEYGRANIKGTSVFYGSMINPEVGIEKTKICSLLEGSRLYLENFPVCEEDDTFGVWRLKAGETLNMWCMIHPSSLPNVDDPELKKIRDLYEMALKNLPIEFDKIDLDSKTKYFSQQFQKENKTGNDYNYLITACFANEVMKRYDGILYPSVKMQTTDFVQNVAIRPNVVDEKMELVDVVEYKFIKKENEIQGNRIRHLSIQGDALVQM